jgi:hypothetical protein
MSAFVGLFEFLSGRAGQASQMLRVAGQFGGHLCQTPLSFQILSANGALSSQPGTTPEVLIE